MCGGSKYTDALKKFNAGKPAWCMPRKGTELHAEVLSLIEKPKTRKLRKAPVVAPTKKTGKETEAELTNTPEFKERMKEIRAETRETKKQMLERQKISNEKYQERLKQRRREKEQLKITNPKLYAEIYPENVFKTSSDFN